MALTQHDGCFYKKRDTATDAEERGQVMMESEIGVLQLLAMEP